MMTAAAPSSLQSFLAFDFGTRRIGVASGTRLLGTWTDAVYLSTSNRWGITALRLGTVTRTNGLLQNETYSNSIPVIIEIRVTPRRIGKPMPSFCAGFCGYSV